MIPKRERLANMIPKTIHYCWFGGNKMPPIVKKCINSWYKFCPDYEIIRWDESNYDYTKHPYMSQAYNEKKWSFVSDYARLDIIYEYGGIYLDTDVELIKSVTPLLYCEGFAGFSIDKESIATGLIFAAVKEHEMIAKMREIYKDVNFINRDGSYNLQRCPYYNTLPFIENGLVQNNTYQVINGIHIYPSDYFCPVSPFDKKPIITENTYSIHHFTALWYDKKTRLRHTIVKKIANLLGENLFSKVHSIKKTLVRR